MKMTINLLRNPIFIQQMYTFHIHHPNVSHTLKLHIVGYSEFLFSDVL